MNLRRLWEEKAARNGGRTFLVFGDDRVSYAEMHARSNGVANALREHGIRKGDTVAVMLGNGAEFLYVWFGLAKLGAVMVPINTANRGDSLAYILHHSDSRLIFLDARHRATIDAVRARVPGLEHLVEVPAADASPAARAPFAAWVEGADRLKVDDELGDAA